MQAELEKRIVSHLYNERCPECNEHLAEGVVSCSICEVEFKAQFHFDEASH